jgi:hypothetical protein
MSWILDFVKVNGFTYQDINFDKEFGLNQLACVTLYWIFKYGCVES